jgi:hypothetical protein
VTRANDTTESRALRLLWLDGGAGFAVGAAMLLLRAWLTGIYGMSVELVVFIGAANLGYGCYSGTLAALASMDRWPPRRAIDVLVAANLAWMVVCVVLLLVLHASVGMLGLGHVALEGIFVTGLAWSEHRYVRPVAS